VLAAWSLAVLAVLVSGVTLTVSLPADAYDTVTILASVLGAVVLAATGAILVTRLRRNPIGWLLVGSGALLALANLSSSPLPADQPLVVAIAWAGNLAWAPTTIALGILLPLVYPSGRLPSPRWRIVVAIAMVALVLSSAQSAFSPFPAGSAPPGVRNPLAVSGAPEELLGWAGSVSMVAGIIFFPFVALSLVLRYGRASGVERAQLRWLAAALSLVGPGFAVGFATSGASSGPLLVVSYAAWLVAIIGMALLPLAIGIAVLRYRLYEIDRIISRTLSWTILTLVLAGAFTGVVITLQLTLSPLLQSNELAVAGSTLVVAALFQPLRRNVQGRVDRRFNRSRHDAELVLAGFVNRLRDEVDMEYLRSDLLASVAAALEPAAATLWLRDPDGP
jgi:hypothetical protein